MKSYTAHEIAMMPDWSDLRLDKGLSLEKISAATNIPERKLQALERHEFADLGPATFATGYLRNYAKILKEDPEIFVQVYRDAMVPEPGESITSTDNTIVIQRRRPQIWQKLNVLHLLGIAIVVWVAVVFIRDEAPLQTFAEEDKTLAETMEPMPTRMEDIVQTVAPQAEDLARLQAQRASLTSELGPSASEILAAEQSNRESEPVQTADAAGLPEAGRSEVNRPDAAQSNAPAAAADVQSMTISAAENASTAPADADVLIFSFEDDCWVEVKSSDDSVLIAELKRKGDNLRLFGQAPFNILLGNARSVNLTLNGEAVKIQPIDGRKTLRFTASG